MLVLRSLVFNIWTYLSMAVMGVLGAPAALWSPDGAYWVMKAYSRQLLWALERICKLRIEVRGTPPEGPCLVAAKHQSFIDMVVLMRAMPRPSYVMKQELKWAPFLGWYALRIGAAPVARGKGAKAIRQMTQAVEKIRHDRRQLVIFPQGTRIAPGVKAPYKIGAARLYESFGLRCVPVATNVGAFWGRNSFLRRPGTAVFAFLDPIEPGLETGAFMRAMETRIEGESDALLQEAEAAGWRRRPAG